MLGPSGIKTVFFSLPCSFVQSHDQIRVNEKKNGNGVCSFPSSVLGRTQGDSFLPFALLWLVRRWAWRHQQELAFWSRGHSHILRNKIESGTWWSYHTSAWLPNIYMKTNKQKLLSCFRHRYFGFVSLAAKSNPNFTHWNIHWCIYLSGVILINMPWSLSSILS